MSNKVDVVLWEDLDDVKARICKALEVLQSIEQALAEDRVSQPSRQSSTHLTRLNVLTELLYTEVSQFVEDMPFKSKAHA